MTTTATRVLTPEEESVFAYRFAKHDRVPTERPDIFRGVTPEQFLDAKYQRALIFGLQNLQQTGWYRISGWSFDFTPYMKRFVVKQYDSWQEYWAPNKTLLRRSLYGRIEKIVAIEN